MGESKSYSDQLETLETLFKFLMMFISSSTVNCVKHN